MNFTSLTNQQTTKLNLKLIRLKNKLKLKMSVSVMANKTLMRSIWDQTTKVNV